MENTDMYIGRMLDDRYEILEKIGTGGMAVVYKARCHRLNRLVAVKILKADLAQDEDFRRRFHAESQAVAMLSHPNIVSVYDVSSAGNIDYIVMELIEGITLKQYINRKGQLNWKEVLHFSTQIVKAVSHAHSRGIVHRDIKPHNIMILKDGSVKVADFGIARLLTTQQNTLTQEALGSVHYISPEQAKGSHVDFRTDLYSIGVVMYEMLTSRLPFEGDSAVAIALQHISSVPLMPREINPNVPAGLEEITMHAMDGNLDERYKTADEMLVDLEEFRKNPAVQFTYAMPSGSSERVQATVQKTAAPAVDAAQKKKAPVSVSRATPKEDYAQNKRKAGKTSILIGVFCVILFLLLVFMFIYRFFLKDILNPSDERIIIPNFVNEYYEDVINDEEYDLYYNFTYTFEESSEFEEGKIMEQTPAANRQMTVLENGIDVELVVSAGEDEVFMPNIINKDYREAEIMLQNLDIDLDIQVTGEFSDDVTKDYVMEQVPAEGEKLTKGGTVYITKSDGPEVKMTTVPSVTGIYLEQAKSRLESYDLDYSVEYVDDSADKDMVIFQSIEDGEEVPIGTVVKIQVSYGPPEEPDPPVDEPTEPTTPPEDTGDEGTATE